MRKKKILFYFSGFLAFVCLVAALLPSFFSTNIGKQVLLSFISRHVPGKIEVQSLDLGWSSEQKIQGLMYKADNNRLQISCPEISSSSGLWRSLFSSDLGTVNIKMPVMEIHEVTISSPQPVKPRIQAASFLGSLPINTLLPHISIATTCDIQIEKGKASIFSQKNGSIIVDDLAGHILAQKKSVSAKIQGTTHQKDLEGTFFIEANWALDTSLDVQATFSHFPIQGADALLSAAFPQNLGYLAQAIGPFLDFKCHVKIAQQECYGSLQAQSEHMQAKIQTELKENGLALSSPASLQISLSPIFLQNLQKIDASLQGISLTDPLSLSFTIDQLHIPKTETGVDLSKASFEARLDTKPFLFSDLTLESNGRFSSSSLSEEIRAHIDLLLKKKKESSTSSVEISVKDPLSPSRKGNAFLRIGKTPTSFLQNLFPQASFANILGSYVEVEGSLEKESLFATLHSEFLEIPKSHFLWKDNTLSLQGPTQIKYLVTPALVMSLAPSPSLALQKPSPIEINLSSLEFSSLQEMKMQATISSPSLVFSKLFSLENYAVDSLSCQLDMNSLSKIFLQITSDPFDCTFAGGVDLSSYALFWEKPLQVRYTLSDREMQLIPLQKTHPKLAQKAPCYLQVDPGSYCWLAPSLDQIKFTLHLQIPTLSLQNPLLKEQVSLQNIQSTVNLLGAQHKAKASFSTKIGEGTISCEGLIEKIFSKDPTINGQVKVQQLPLQLVNVALPSMPSWPSLFGPSLDASLQVEANSQSKTCWIEAKSSLLQIVGGITLDSQGVFLTKAKAPLHIEYSLTPQAYDLLTADANRPFHLEKNALIKASISQLSVPFISATSKVPDIKKLRLQSQIENQEISFQHKETKKNLRLQNTRISLQKKDEKTPLSLQLDTFSEGSQKGALHISAVCKQILNPKGNLQLSHMESDLKVSFQTFPSAVLDIIIPSKNKQKDPFAHLLGPSFNLALTASLQNGNGPLALNLQSPNVQLSLDGALKAGALLLHQNARAQCLITPETSKVLLQEINPLSISSLSADTPITIEISSKGFSFPISPFAYKYVQIPQGRITLGKLWCQNEGNVNLMLEMLKAQQTSKNKQLALWFAPLDFHVRNGVVDIERTEILIADVYDMALWGRVDLPENRVNMNLGLTASCLKAAMNIKKLPADYVLHIPLTGTLDHVELNKKVATSKIVALTLWQNKDLAGKAVGGGLGGALVGGLLDQVLTPPGNDSPTPPAKRPFPWEASK